MGQHESGRKGALGQSDAAGATSQQPSRQPQGAKLTPREALMQHDGLGQDGDQEAIADDVAQAPKSHLTHEQEQKLLPVLTRLFDAAFRMGMPEFKEAARWVLDSMGNYPKLGQHTIALITVKHLQGAYIAMSARYPNGSTDDVATVSRVTSKDQIMKSSKVSDRPRDLEPLDADALLGKVEPDSENDAITGTAKEIGNATPHRQSAPGRIDDGLFAMRTKLAGRRQRLILVVAVAVVVGVPAWFYRFQPLPTMAGGAFINRWTGTIYVVGLNGRYTVAEPIRESDR